jgi:hypothetical protein
VLSVRRQTTRLAVLAVGASLLVAGVAGCSTTQEKAAIQQARAKRVLETRDDRKKKKREKAREARENGSQKQ